ncbi:general secretion pathway protein GspB [Marinobacter sp.]|uniref:general secretion pathway protein GspB n=1 Tax=Marinobacter sp. TaxID=50741 RepID=UPI003568CA77
MSYILDALRKSEAERRQGKAPDLGQQVQMVYRPKKKPVSAVVWVALALMANAAVLAYMFWSSKQVQAPVDAEMPTAKSEPLAEPEHPASINQLKPEPEVTVPLQNEPAKLSQALVESSPEEPAYEQPTVIVPSQSERRMLTAPPVAQIQGRVPHLVELPLSFQKSVPDLTFNSHIYSSDPSASRVMINNRYLRTGEGFGQLMVENITEDGVVLSKNGQRFRVGIVRDWVSPR